LTPTGDKPDDLQTLAKGGRTNVGGFFIRLIARIPFLIIGGQWYGAEALGRLAYAIVVVELAAQLCTLGLKRGLALHLAGDGKENGAWDGLVVVLAATLIPTVALIIFPQIMFPNSAINRNDNLLPLVIPALAASDLMLAALAYRFDIASTVRARAIIEPWTISIVAFALAWHWPRDGLLIAYAASMAAALLASVIPFLRTFGLPKEWMPKGGELYALARRNTPLAAADAIEWGSRRLDIALLGLFVSPKTVGIYWVAQQIASLPQKLKTSFDPVLGPVITQKLAEGDRPGIARQISQVGFWIIAAQAGVALVLGISGEAIMGLIGPGGAFVGGNGALAFLLLAEVAAAAAVVSEAALVYIARYKNLAISLAMIGIQATLTYIFVSGLKRAGYPELYQAAGPAMALACSLAFASLAKSLLASRLLGERVSVWRWPLLIAISATVLLSQIIIRLPEWFELAFGLPAMLALYGWVIWRVGFREDDRILFKRTKR
jgi:O-antigen/teichoic acid export membrane protein